MKWISVKDRLPSLNQNVVVLYNWKTTHNEKNVGRHICFYRKFKGKYGFLLYNYDVIENVTYWMPLPEPPKE